MLGQGAVLRELGALTRTVHAIIDVQFKTINLQKGQSIYLTRICENPGISLMDLSRKLMMDKSSSTKAVKKLISGGLVLKAQDPHDKRSYQLFPTPKAKDVYNFIIEEESRQVQQCYSGFNDEEKAAVCELVRKMRRNIEEDWYSLKNYRHGDRS